MNVNRDVLIKLSIHVCVCVDDFTAVMVEVRHCLDMVEAPAPVHSLPGVEDTQLLDRHYSYRPLLAEDKQLDLAPVGLDTLVLAEQDRRLDTLVLAV